jgi:hypothetical protein
MAISWHHECHPGLTLTPPPGEREAMCSVGRWMTHPSWPGWQEPCPASGTECDFPPYVTCARHAGELRHRTRQTTEENDG